MVQKIGVKKLRHTGVSVAADVLDRIDKIAQARSLSRGEVIRGLLFTALEGQK